MSTRGFVGVRIDGQVKTGYNHMDSYASWLGIRVLAAARDMLVDPAAYVLWRERGRDLVAVDDDHIPTAAQRTKVAQVLRDVPPDGDWYTLLRRAQGDLPTLLTCGFIAGYRDWPGSSSCEYGYLIDFDNRSLQVWSLYASEPDPMDWLSEPPDEGHGIVGEWKAEHLPSDSEFLSYLAGRGERLA